jgi:hypothetical protein
MAGAWACIGEMRYGCRILLRIREGNRSLARYTCRLEDNIKMDHK